MEKYYHIYNRGAHKALMFLETSDYQRFLQLLYLSNSVRSFQIRNFGTKNIFHAERIEKIVQIIAYCLMPNHFHIVVVEKTPGGITKFMRKLCTGYSMYYNVKYAHSGTIIQGKYKSKIIVDDLYLKTVINYVHLNPFSIKEPDMTKDAKSEHLKDAYEYSGKYEFSSLKDYNGENRAQKSILA